MVRELIVDTVIWITNMSRSTCIETAESEEGEALEARRSERLQNRKTKGVQGNGDIHDERMKPGKEKKKIFNSHD